MALCPRTRRSVLAAGAFLAALALGAGFAPTAAARARAGVLAAPALTTSDAEGAVVNRLAVRVRRSGARLTVHVFLVGRSLSAGSRALTLRAATCDAAGRRCTSRATWTVALTDGETQVRREQQVSAPRAGGTVVVTLGTSSLRLVLPATAWRPRTPSWYGLKTPSTLWGGTTFRSLRVHSVPRPDGTMDVSMSTALDLGSAPAAGGPVSAVLGTLDARGAWRVNGRSDVTRQPGAPLTRTSVRSRVAPPFRQHGFGMYATNADAPLMVVWLPPPAT